MDIRRVVNAILDVNRTGCPWRILPHDFPSWRLVDSASSTWRDAKPWATIHAALLAPTRATAGRADTPTAGGIDRSTVKATEGEDRGFDGGTRLAGRKRHTAAGTPGLRLALVATGARVGDAQAAPAVLRQLPPDEYPRLERPWADQGYHTHALGDWLRDTCKGPIRIPATTRTDAEPGFEPVRWRWAIERTNGRVKRSRRTATDYEHPTSSHEAMVWSTMTKLLLDRLTDT